MHVDVHALAVDGVHVRIRPQPPAPPKHRRSHPRKVAAAARRGRSRCDDVRVTRADVAITGVGEPDTHIDDVTIAAKADIAGDQISASLAIVGAYREKQPPFALATQGFQLDGTRITLHDLAAMARRASPSSATS